MSCNRDILGDYRLSATVTEEDILRAAEEILTRRYQREGEAISDPRAAGAFLKMRLAGRPNEVFVAVFLDTRHRIISTEELFYGTIDGAEVHPRVVVKRALELNAAALLIAHNHPSGNPEPSAADRAVTARLKQALDLVDIRLLDHFVIGGTSAPVSLAARGWI